MANKVFNILKIAFKAIAVALALISFFMPAITSLTVDATGMPTSTIYVDALMPTGFVLAVIACFVGGLLTFAGKKEIELTGYGLFLAPILAVIAIVTEKTPATQTMYTMGTGTIFMIVAAALVVLSIAMGLIAMLLAPNANSAKSLDERIDTLKTFKELLEEGIITDEEYEAKRCELLKIQGVKKPAAKDNKLAK